MWQLVSQTKILAIGFAVVVAFSSDAVWAEPAAGHKVDRKVERKVERHTERYRRSRAPIHWHGWRARPVPKFRRPSKRVIIVAPRRRVHRDVHIYRPYGPTIFGYGYHYADSDAFAWLAFTAITLAILDNLNERQVRMHEQAQILAAEADVGEQIVWEDGDVNGSVVTLRRGADAAGNQCREFQQTVTIGGEIETAYGTACLQPDGSWKIVD